MPTITFTAALGANFLLIAFSLLITLIVVGIWFASRNPYCKFDWTDLILDPITRKASLTRVLQLIGGLTGTFVIVWHTLKLNLTAEMFAIYLAALGVSEGFSKWVQLKYKVKEESTEDKSN